MTVEKVSVKTCIIQADLHSFAQVLFSASVCRVERRNAELIIDSMRRKLTHRVP